MQEVECRGICHSYDGVRDAVAEVVRARQKEENNRASFDQLRARYDVRIEPAVTQ